MCIKCNANIFSYIINFNVATLSTDDIAFECKCTLGILDEYKCTNSLLEKYSYMRIDSIPEKKKNIEP